MVKSFLCFTDTGQTPWVHFLFAFWVRSTVSGLSSTGSHRSYLSQWLSTYVSRRTWTNSRKKPWSTSKNGFYWIRIPLVRSHHYLLLVSFSPLSSIHKHFASFLHFNQFTSGIIFFFFFPVPSVGLFSVKNQKIFLAIKQIFVDETKSEHPIKRLLSLTFWELNS